jgi:GNAT superfamily N-acetyltransferase
MDLTIRKAEPADLDTVTRMCKSSIAATYGSFLDEEAVRPWSEGGETDKYVARMLRQMLVAEAAGQVVAVVALDTNTVDLLWVELPRRGQGIGRRLLAAAEEALRADGFSKGRLECFEPNTDAIAFYRKNGWRRVSAHLDDCALVNKVVMEKSLPADT